MNENKINYFVTGSVASIVYGEPRLTNDIDLIISVFESQVDVLIKAFPFEEFYIPPKEIIITELRRPNRGHMNIIHHKSGFKADIYFVGKDEFQLWALENKKEIVFLNTIIPVAPAEYVIIKKLEFYKEGFSSKHITDIQNILTNSKALIDFDFLENNIIKYNLTNEWKKVTSNL
ncbi:MAG: hypothetical protein V1773_05935 [bacterium]